MSKILSQITKLVAIVVLQFLASQAMAQPGAVNLNFNALDVAGAGLGPNAPIRDMALQADGKLIVVGSFITYNNVSRPRIARLNADGTLDEAFTVGSGVSGTANSVAVQADGKILLGGSFISFNAQTVGNIVRLNTDGTVDATFLAGTGTNGTVNDIVLQPDGKILIGGFFTTYQGITANRIARLTTTGGKDPAFDTGAGASSTINTIALQTDGKILIGGAFTTYNGVIRTRIARILATGAPDGTFAPIGANNTVQSLAIQPDGKILVAGYFSLFNNSGKVGIVRIGSTGIIDNGFVAMPDGFVNTITLQPDGKILIGGTFLSVSYTNNTNISVNSPGIARLSSIGSIEGGFTGLGDGSNVSAIALKPDGSVLIGGNFTRYNGITKPNLIQTTSAGVLEQRFNPVYGPSNKVSAIGLQPDGKILIGGVFTVYNGAAANYFTRLSADGTPDASYLHGSSANSSVNAIAIQPDGKAIIGGSFTTYNGTLRGRIARLNTNGSVETAFNSGTGANNIVNAIALQQDGKILIGGNFTLYGSIARNRLARLNADGTLDASFNVGAGLVGSTVSVRAIAVQPDGKILVGGIFVGYNGINRQNIVRLNPDGSIDPDFKYTYGANVSVLAFALQPDGKILVGGGFNVYNDANAGRIVRLNSDGTTDTGFNVEGSGANNLVNSIALEPGGKILIGGSFTTYNTLAARVARLNSDGTVDGSFIADAASGDITAIALETDGKILIGGGFSAFNGTNRRFLAELQNVVTPSAPGSPAIANVTAANGEATVTFTPPASNGWSAITSYTVTSSPGELTASGTGSPLVVTGLIPGVSYTFTVTASNAIGTSAPSEASQEVTSAQMAPTITFAPIAPIGFGTGPANLIASSNSPAPIVFTSSDPSVAEVNYSESQGWRIQPLRPGTVTITASQVGLGEFAAGSLPQTISVLKGQNKIIVEDMVGRRFGEPDQPVLASSPTGQQLTYTLSNPSTISINDGLIHIIKPGTVAITAHIAESDNYYAADTTWTFTAEKGISASIVLSGLITVYDGTAKSATVTTIPEGLGNLVRLSYNESETAPVNAGDYVVKADLNEYYETSEVINMLTIQKAEQHIVFDQIPNKTFNDQDFSLMATGGISGNAVSFTSSNPEVATVFNGFVHIIGGGTTTLTASQEGNENYFAAVPVVQSLTISKATATVSLTDASYIYDGSVRALNAITNPADLSGLALTYNGSSTAPVSAGTYTVVATLSNPNYTASQAIATLTISKAEQTIVWNTPAAITYGTALSAIQLNATAEGALTYSPEAGTILNAGTQTLSVSAAATDNYSAASKSVSLTVNKAEATITLSNASVVYDGSAKVLSANTNPANLSGLALTYNGSSTAPISAGTYTVVATLSNANYTASQATATLTISKAEQTIVWNTPAAITYGTALSEVQLNATAEGALTYTPEAGTVLNAGTQTLSISAAATDNYSAASKTVSLTVNKAEASISMASASFVYDGSAKVLSAITNPANLSGLSLTYNGSSTAPVSAGTYTVVATLSNSNYTASQATATLTIGKAEQVIVWNTPAAITYGIALSAIQLNASAEGAIIYTPEAGTVLYAGTQTLNVSAAATDNYSAASKTVTLTVNKAEATIALSSASFVYDGSGKGLTATTNPANLSGLALTYNGSSTAPISAGTYTVVATLSNANYTASQATATLTINKTEQTIVWNNPDAITYGTALSEVQLNATAEGALTYSPEAGTILNAGTQTLSVSAAATDNYSAASKTVTLTVNKAEASIFLASASFVYDGSGKGLNASIIPADLSGLSLTYNGSTFAPSAPGTYSVVATLNNPNYTASQGTATLTISPAEQIIVWNTPDAVTYGTALSALQLNATAPGSLTYSPAAGTVLDAGSQVLGVSSAATANYAAATKTVTLVVNKAAATLTLGNLTQLYDGISKPVTVSTTPSGLTGVSVTYNGSSIIPFAAGSYAVVASLDNANYTASPVSATLTITQPVYTSLKLQYRNNDSKADDNEISPYLKIVNTGTSAVPYSQITARYWFSPENFNGVMGMFVENAVVGNNNVTMKYVMLPDPRSQALGYVEYSFSAGAGSLAANSSGEIQSRIANPDKINFDELNDHSYAPKANTYIDNTRITLYRSGVLVWGTEPAAETPVMKLKVYSQAQNGPKSTIGTVVEVRNEGNVPADYKDLVVRYWFTSEGTQPLSFALDSKTGGSATGSFVKLNPAKINADTYLELKVGPAASTLYPFSSTGNIQYSINKSDGSNFTQTNDHSYQAGLMNANKKITVYYKGQLVFGTEPASLSALTAMSANLINISDNGPSSLLMFNKNNEAAINTSEGAGPEATNLITPNGDGINDTWVIRNSEPNTAVRIIDGNGRQVYSTSNYTNDWNGTFKGAALPQGTYYYFIENNNEKGAIRGYISIVR